MSKRILTLTERLQVIEEYEKNPSIDNLIEKFKYTRRQIRVILQRKKEYLEISKNRVLSKSPRLSPTASQIATLGTVMYEWVKRCLSHNVPITDDLLRQTGEKFAKLMRIHGFRPNDLWLNVLKKRYQLSDLEKLATKLTASGEIFMQRSLCLEEIVKTVEFPDYPFFYIPVQPCVRQYKRKNLKTPNGTNQSSGVRTSHDEQSSKVQTSHAEQYSSHSDDNEIEMHCAVAKSDVKEETNLIDIISASSDADISLPTTEINASSEAFEGIYESQTATITSYEDALKHLVPLENFALLSGNIRAIGIINQLENHLKEISSLTSE